MDYNIETTAKYLKRAAPMKQWLEMEIGITGLFDAQGTTKISANQRLGGEEDGVNNEGNLRRNPCPCSTQLLPLQAPAGMSLWLRSEPICTPAVFQRNTNF